MSEQRVHYLDWLKVLIVYGIVLFHVALVFSYGPWLVNNPERSLVLSAFAGFCFPWGIPAMFLIAGADAWFALGKHSLGRFIRQRFLRLLVPMVPGLIVLSPLQRFIVSSSPPPPIERLPAFYLTFFQGMHFDWTLQMVSQYWLHLWFLGYLFAISLVCGPLILWLRAPAGRRFTAWLVAVASRRGGMLLFAAPMAAAQLVLRPRFPEYQGWADMATYTFAFASGAILISDRRFAARIRRQLGWFLAGVAGALLGLGLLTLVSTSISPTRPGSTAAEQVALALLWSLFIWSAMLALLYAGVRWLDFPNRAIAYAQESVLAVYVIHHPYVLLVASFAVTWPLALWPKFVVVVALVFALTLFTYEFGVRRWAVTRFVFGLGPMKKRTSETPAAGSLRLSTG